MLSASPSWIVAQIGAREHYAVARAVHERGHLERLYTDFWCSPAWRGVQRAPQPLKSLAGRQHPSIPLSHVVAFSGPTLRSEMGNFVSRRLGRSTGSKYDQFIHVGKDFSHRVRAHWQQQKVDPQKQVFFGYNTGCLELLEWLREQNVTSVVDQIDPGRVEGDLVEQERVRWPGWESEADPIPEAYYERLSAEWELATHVLVNSPWSAQALALQGVSPEKIVVVPLAFDVPASTAKENSPSPTTKPLHVLWLGTVNLRKGIPYLLEAAKLLESTSIRFLVAGPIEISEKAVASAPANVEFLGRVDRSDAQSLYQRCDLFVLPTISDGFAITQLEAMANGLPVVTTPRCGEVVTTGVDGMLVPPGDAPALAEAIRTLDQDRPLLQEMSRAARRRSTDFSLERYAAELEGALSSPSY